MSKSVVGCRLMALSACEQDWRIFTEISLYKLPCARKVADGSTSKILGCIQYTRAELLPCQKYQSFQNPIAGPLSSVAVGVCLWGQRRSEMKGSVA
jgi:hypothetical protein